MTKVKMLKQTFWGDTEHSAMSYFVGQVADVPEAVSARWIQRRIAAVTVKSVPVETDIAPLIESEGHKVPGMRELIGKGK